MSGPYNLKRVGKFYHCDFVVRGVRVHRSTKCAMKGDAEGEAKRWYDAALDKANGVTPRQAPDPDPTLVEVYEDWLRLKKPQRLSKSHLKDMRVAVTLHAGEWADLPITSLDNAAIEEIRARYLSTPGVGFSVDGKGTVRSHSAGGANDIVRSLSTDFPHISKSISSN